jgi:hypothetical protein
MFSACHENKSVKEQLATIAKRDTVVVKDTVIVVLQKTIIEKNETTFVSKKLALPNNEKEPKLLPQVKKEKEILPSKQVTIYSEPKDTQYFFYKNSKAVSVKITPWKDSKQQTILFDPFGNETYKMEAVRSSYQVSVSLRFQPNGAVDKAHIHTNPGASMYWYETDITFSLNNEPEWKNTEQQPMNQLKLPQPEYWDKKLKAWQKQEAME